MRTSIQLVAVIRHFAVLANAASLVALRFAASFNPEMYRFCYVHRESVDRGRTVAPTQASWRSDRYEDRFGISRDPVTRPTDSKHPSGMSRTTTRQQRDEYSSRPTVG
jgi:hypothetical protein